MKNITGGGSGTCCYWLPPSAGAYGNYYGGEVYADWLSYNKDEGYKVCGVSYAIATHPLAFNASIWGRSAARCR